MEDHLPGLHAAEIVASFRNKRPASIQNSESGPARLTEGSSRKWNRSEVVAVEKHAATCKNLKVMNSGGFLLPFEHDIDGMHVYSSMYHTSSLLHHDG